MIKTKVRDLPIIAIHLEHGDKEALTTEAQKRGMMLTTYCRMVLLDSLRERSEEYK